MFSKRRWLFVVLALMATFSLVLVSCAGNANNNLNGPEDPLAPPADDPMADPDADLTPTPEDDPLADPDDDPAVAPDEEATPTPEPTPTLEATPEGEAMLPDEADEDDVGGFGRGWALSSRLIGWRVESQTGDEISDIDEILFGEDGEIHYVILDVEDYLDLDEDRIVAVEWDMLEFRLPHPDAVATTDDNGTENDTLNDTDVVTVTRAVVIYTGSDEDLRQATAIDTDTLDDANLVVDATELGLDVEEGNLFRLSHLDNTDFLGTYDVVNEDNENLGDVDDTVLNMDEGVVQYVIVGVGGFLGIGEKHVAIPWEMVTYDEAEDNLVIPVTEDELDEAPEVDLGEIRTEGFYEGWNEESATYWDETLPETGVNLVGVAQHEDPDEDQDLTEDPDLAEQPDTTAQVADGPEWALASELLNTPVETQDGQTVAEAENALFDMDGQIRYVILDIDTDLDDVDEQRTVAVAYDMFDVRFEREDNDNGLLNNDNDQDTNDNDLDNNDTITPTDTTVDRGAAVLVYKGTQDQLLQETEIDRDLLNDREVITDTTELGLDAPDAQLLQVADFNYRIVNQEGNRISTVDDLILNLHEGTVRYIVVGVGGFLGIGQDYVAVPWDMIEYDEQENNLVMAVSDEDEEQLRDAPTIDLSTKRDEGFAADWNRQTDAYWDGTLPELGEDPDAPAVTPDGPQWALAGELLNTRVETQDGQTVADADNMLFDTDGQIRFVILDLDTDLDEVDQARTVAVDYDRFQVRFYREDNDNGLLNNDNDQDNNDNDLDNNDTITPTNTITPTDTAVDRGTPVLVYMGTQAELAQEPEIDRDLLNGRRVITDPTELGLDAPDARLLQVADFDYRIRNLDGDRVGIVDDLILNLQDNRVGYVVVGVGGFLGIGRDYVAVPWEAIRYNAQEDTLVMQVTEAEQEHVRDAPTMNLRTIRNEGFTPGWNEEVDVYWEETLPELGADPADAHRWVLTSELVGSMVQTQDGEEISQIENILFNLDGELRYVVFDVGGLMEDVSTYMVAVEWDRFEVMTPTMPTTNDVDPAPVAPADPETPADPEGPADPQPTPTPDADAPADAPTAPGTRADVQTTTPVLVYTGTVEELTQRPELDRDLLGERVITDTAALGLDTAVDDRLLQANDLRYDIVNRDGDDIGRVFDLVLDQQEDRVAYLVVGVGGFLGIGRQYVAVPWEMVDYNEAEDALQLPISAEDDEVFDEAPTIDLRGFRNDGFRPGWNRPTNRYWQNRGMVTPAPM